jgi:hypothetical protein
MSVRRRSTSSVACVVAVLLAVSAAAFAARSYSDRVGDVKGGSGPDLTSLTLSSTRTTVTFRVRFTHAPPLRASTRDGWVDMLLIGIDVPPRSLSRGAHGWTGLDYEAGLHGAETTAVVVRAAPATPSQPGRVVARPSVRVSGRTLGDPAWIEVVVAAGREMSGQAAGGGSDEAPNRGTFHYQLRR